MKKLTSKVIATGIACIISISLFSQNQKYGCDTVYKTNRLIQAAKFYDGIPDILNYMGKELYCRPNGDTIYFKIITFLIDKKGQPYLIKATGYQPECESNIRKMVEKMLPWSPALKNKVPVCFEEDIPIIIKKNN